MPDDFRLKVGFPGHPKTTKLISKAGFEAFWSLVKLIEFCAMTRGRHDGNLKGMSNEDIEIAAGWVGEPGALVAALSRVKYLEGRNKSRRIHEFRDHNPWLAGAADRSAAASNAAKTRWNKRKNGMRGASKGNAPTTDPQCPVSNSDSVSVSVSNSDPVSVATRIVDDAPLGLAELNRLIEQDTGRSIMPKWVPKIEGMADHPPTRSEYAQALLRAQAQSADPTPGLVLAILLGDRKTDDRNQETRQQAVEDFVNGVEPDADQGEPF